MKKHTSALWLKRFDMGMKSTCAVSVGKGEIIDTTAVKAKRQVWN